MQPTEYKFERFSDPQFPIYLSAQSGRKTLVRIHYHTSAELIQVMEGRVELFAGGTRRECMKGDLIFIPPSVVHEVVSQTEDAAIRGLIYERTLVEMKHLSWNLSALFGAGQRVQYVITPQNSLHETMCTCIDNIRALYADDSMSGRMQIISCLMQLEAALIRIFALEETAADQNYRKLQPVLNYLNEHYAEKIHISQLSAILHVCDDRLIRLFKQVTGETPVAYLTNLRMEACLRLLAGTEDSIAAIAEKTGFGSDTYMTRVFKEKLGSTPGKYRRHG